jgi:hypothetical protein
MTLPDLNLDFKGQNSHFVTILKVFWSNSTKFDLRDQFLTSKLISKFEFDVFVQFSNLDEVFFQNSSELTLNKVGFVTQFKYYFEMIGTTCHFLYSK